MKNKNPNQRKEARTPRAAVKGRSTGEAQQQAANVRQVRIRNGIKDAIVSAAAKLFRERGVESSSMREIAEIVGFSRTALYYHFRNKDEILAVLVEEVTLHSMREAIRIMSGSTTGHDETLHAMVRAYALWILRHPEHFVVLQRDDRRLSKQVQLIQAKGKRDLRDAFSHQIRLGSEAGVFREQDADVAALCIFGMCNWTTEWFKQDGRISDEKVADVIADFAVNMVRAPLSPSGNGKGDVSALFGMLRDSINRLERNIKSRASAKI